MLEVHVFGSSKGESILIRLPDDLWGVVDCYAAKPDDLSSNRALVYARDVRNVKSFDFVCMTHPHDDHYTGLYQVLTNFQVREFWSPAVMGGDCLEEMLIAKKFDEFTKTGPPEELTSLSKLLKHVREEARRTSVGRLRSERFNIDSVINRPGGWPDGVEISTFGPSGTQAARYHDRLTKCFDGDDRFNGKHGDHNLCSLGLRISWKDTHVVLGGDIEKPGWRDALERVEHKLANASLVKLAHHGSQNGRHDNLWTTFGKPKVAVVTAYQSSALPRKATLEEAKLIAEHVFSASPLDSSQTPKPTSANIVLAKRNSGHSRNSAHGRCSFSFNQMGGLVGVELEGAAHELK